MQEVFKRIIDKLEEQKKGNPFIYGKNDKSRDASISRQTLDYAIEIVEQAAEECKHGHFGCDLNGQHEKCSSCCDYDCKNRNREWFGAKDDNNGWIPVSERLPNQDGEFTDVLITCESMADGVFVQSAEFYIASDGEPVFETLYHYESVLAWKTIPDPYQPKGE